MTQPLDDTPPFGAGAISLADFRRIRARQRAAVEKEDHVMTCKAEAVACDTCRSYVTARHREYEPCTDTCKILLIRLPDPAFHEAWHVAMRAAERQP